MVPIFSFGIVNLLKCLSQDFTCVQLCSAAFISVHLCPVVSICVHLGFLVFTSSQFSKQNLFHVSCEYFCEHQKYFLLSCEERRITFFSHRKEESNSGANRNTHNSYSIDSVLTTKLK